jgi:hypothetical protein
MYLYGVVPADGEKNLGPIGPGGSEVRAVSCGGIGIVAAKADRMDFSLISPEKTLEHLADHQRVLESVMAGSTVIPLKFGTYADDDRQIIQIIRDGREEFAAALQQHAGKVEVDLGVLWTNLSSVLSDIAHDEAVVCLKAQIASQSQATRHDRVRMGQLVKTLLDERRTNVAEQLVAALKANWPDMVVNPAKDDSVILSAAILIGHNDQAKLDSAIHQLDRLFDDRITFRCVGPLPPYSFATAEVRTVDAARLDGARLLLGLGECASLTEMKAAYRRLLQELHPDRNPDADAGDAMQEVTGAYELLEEYALNFKHKFGPAQESGVIVRIRSLCDLRVAKGISAKGLRRRPQPCQVGSA